MIKVIKQAAVTCLCSHGVMKRDEDFNELYQAIYRGVTFALVCIYVPKYFVLTKKAH